MQQITPCLVSVRVRLRCLPPWGAETQPQVGTTRCVCRRCAESVGFKNSWRASAPASAALCMRPIRFLTGTQGASSFAANQRRIGAPTGAACRNRALFGSAGTATPRQPPQHRRRPVRRCKQTLICIAPIHESGAAREASSEAPRAGHVTQPAAMLARVVNRGVTPASAS